MDQLMPKPGDVVRITSTDCPARAKLHRGKDFDVVKCPSRWKNTINDLKHRIWVLQDIGSNRVALCDIATWPPNFEIIQQSNSTCQLCRGTGKITLFTSEVPCDCTK